MIAGTQTEFRKYLFISQLTQMAILRNNDSKY